MTRLSKSRIMSSLQCLKRVHLEIKLPQAAHFSKATKAAFALGHEVGDIAVKLYGGDNGVYIEYSGGSLNRALKQTRELMTSMFRTPQEYFRSCDFSVLPTLSSALSRRS